MDVHERKKPNRSQSHGKPYCLTTKASVAKCETSVTPAITKMHKDNKKESRITVHITSTEKIQQTSGTTHATVFDSHH